MQICFLKIKQSLNKPEIKKSLPPFIIKEHLELKFCSPCNRFPVNTLQQCKPYIMMQISQNAFDTVNTLQVGTTFAFKSVHQQCTSCNNAPHLLINIARIQGVHGTCFYGHNLCYNWTNGYVERFVKLQEFILGYINRINKPTSVRNGI
jgi:hypothetical protein